MFIAALLTTAKIWKQVSINRWIDKEDVVSLGTHQNGTQPLKKEWNFAICSNMNGLGQCYDKWNKSDKERQIPSEIIYMWYINNITN